jgi:uncharacterized protein YaiL (DUF2058 family)
MANLLQQQLIKAGVATADQIKKGDRHKRGEDRRGPSVSDQQRQAQQKKQDADRERNRQQQEQRERKERAAQVRQLIESNRIDRKGGEAAYQFVEAGRIRKFYLHEAQRQQVVAGTLVVVRLGRNFELVLPEVADRIAERDPASVLVRNGPGAASADGESEADPYAAFQVPDDLMW